MLKRRTRKQEGDSAADAERRLAEARALRARTEAQAPMVNALQAEAQRLAKRNRIAEIVFYGLLGGE